MNLVCMLVATVAMGAEAQNEETPVPPEMKVLRRLAGSWTNEWVSPDGSRTTTTGRTQLTLGGRYLQTRAFNEKGELTGITMYTYHVPSQQYRVWHFGSGGVAAKGTGKCGANTQTFTFGGDMEGGGTWQYTLRLVDRKTTDASFTAKDEGGAVIVEAKIKGTRQPRKGTKKKPGQGP